MHFASRRRLKLVFTLHCTAKSPKPFSSPSSCPSSPSHPSPSRSPSQTVTPGFVSSLPLRTSPLSTLASHTPSAYTAPNADHRPANDVELALLVPAIGTLVGCWLGAVPIPLDWDRPWQVRSPLFSLLAVLPSLTHVRPLRRHGLRPAQSVQSEDMQSVKLCLSSCAHVGQHKRRRPSRRRSSLASQSQSRLTNF